MEFLLEEPGECIICGGTFYPTSPIPNWDHGVTEVMRRLCVACLLGLPISKDMAVDRVEIKGYP